MTMLNAYQPAFALTRGQTVESLHHAAIAVVDVEGRLLAWHGDPDNVTFLRSTAKPFQALPFVEAGGLEAFDLTMQELAVMCASHSGTDEHVCVVAGIQAKIGVTEADLLCGVHEPGDQATAMALRERKELPTPLRHNCSGKHTGMLAFARLSNTVFDNLMYIEPQHPIQQTILAAFAEMCHIPASQIAAGIDGCSAPNFAIPQRNAAWAYARLCDPQSGLVSPQARGDACRMITTAMTSYPEMVGGPGRFDTRLMQVGRGQIVAKGGAEGYQGIGLMPGVLYPGSPAVGIAIKVADGDGRVKARSSIAIETLRQLGALTSEQLEALQDFGSSYPIKNWRSLVVGQAYPIFHLQTSGEAPVLGLALAAGRQNS